MENSSKEKQIEEIEEMALTACLDNPGNKELVCINHKMGGNSPCDSRCKVYRYAKELYNAGYRKASEVAREIFALVWDAYTTTYHDAEFLERLNELEKKYTEEQSNDG